MSQTALVTGGAGFIGSHLCELLLEDRFRVVCLDNLSSGRAANLESLHQYEQFTFVKGDVRDSLDATISSQVAPETIDHVYHLASRSSPTDFETYPIDIATTNAAGTREALELAVENEARLVYASTSEVYGDPEVHPQSEEYSGNVNLQGPRVCYDESKRYGEALVNAYLSEHGVDARIARPFNTYGPRLRPNDGRVIPTFLVQALDDTDLTIHGDGSQTRSFLYVDDQVRGLRRLMETPGLTGEVVNIGSTEEVTIETLAETIIELTGSEAGTVYEPRPDDDPEQRRPDISKARRVLDWTPSVSLEDGIERTIPYFEELAG